MEIDFVYFVFSCLESGWFLDFSDFLVDPYLKIRKIQKWAHIDLSFKSSKPLEYRFQH